MIVELATQLLARTEEQLTVHEAETARLQLLRESLEAFIEQPEHGKPRPRSERPAPASTPATGQGSPRPSPSPATDRLRPARSGAAVADRGSSPAGEETSAGARRPARKPANQRPAASLPHGNPPRVTCPDCSVEVRPGGLGPHRRHKHGYRADSNPRTTPPLDLPDRQDQAVGE